MWLEGGGADWNASGRCGCEWSGMRNENRCQIDNHCSRGNFTRTSRPHISLWAEKGQANLERTSKAKKKRSPRRKKQPSGEASGALSNSKMQKRLQRPLTANFTRLREFRLSSSSTDPFVLLPVRLRLCWFLSDLWRELESCSFNFQCG